MSNEMLKQDLSSKNKSSKISSGSEAEPSAKKRDLSPSRRSSHKVKLQFFYLKISLLP